LNLEVVRFASKGIEAAVELSIRPQVGTLHLALHPGQRGGNGGSTDGPLGLMPPAAGSRPAVGVQSARRVGASFVNRRAERSRPTDRGHALLGHL